MKKNNNDFFMNLTIITFICTLITSFLLSNKNINVLGFTATASAVIYPLTYLLSVLYCDKYGKEKTFNLYVYAVFSVILIAIILSLTSIMPIDIDFQIMFALITSFAICNTLNLIIYYYLEPKKSASFFVSSIISITFDSLLFLLLSSLGKPSFDNLFSNFLGQFMISTIVIIIYSFIFCHINNYKTNKKINLKTVDNKKIVKPKKRIQKWILFLLPFS